MKLLLLLAGLIFQNLVWADSLQLAHLYMNQTPLIDGHNDLPWGLRQRFKNQLERVDLTQNLSQIFHTDIPRLRSGHVGGQFWSIFVPCSGDSSWNDNVRDTMEQIDIVHRMVSKYSNHFAIALTPDQLRENFRNGKISSMLGVEGGHSIDSSIAVLRLYFQLGVRYMTLTHSCNVPWADACAPSTPVHHGLTDFGISVVREMNRLGMLVDISHVSHDVMRMVLRHSRAPPIFSHSSAFELCSIGRNVPDDVLMKLRETDGVVMVNFYQGFITCDRRRATIKDVADHVEHIASVAGWKHVGIGADFDGVDELPVGLEDVSKYPNLIAELIGRGWNQAMIAGLLGENVLRVWARVIEVSKEMARIKPVDDILRVAKTCAPNTFRFQK